MEGLPVQNWLHISWLRSKLGPEQKVAQSPQRSVTWSCISGGGHVVVISRPTEPKHAFITAISRIIQKEHYSD